MKVAIVTKVKEFFGLIALMLKGSLHEGRKK
jgi:hypothetical protein